MHWTTAGRRATGVLLLALTSATGGACRQHTGALTRRSSSGWTAKALCAAPTT